MPYKYTVTDGGSVATCTYVAGGPNKKGTYLWNVEARASDCGTVVQGGACTSTLTVKYLPEPSVELGLACAVLLYVIYLRLKRC